MKQWCNLRLVHNHGHPILTMTSLRLRTVDPNRFRIVDLHHEFHGPRSGAQGLKAGKDTTASERVAWICEAALGHGVIPRVVAE